MFNLTHTHDIKILSCFFKIWKVKWILYFLFGIFSIFFSSCREDLKLLESENLSLLNLAKAHYNRIDRGQLLNSVTGDTIDFFDAFLLDWAKAEERTLLNQSKFLLIPIIISDSIYHDSISADYIYYYDSCGLTSEIWLYSKTNILNSNNINDNIYNGWVIVFNQCYQSSQIFAIDQGLVYFSDTICIEPELDEFATTRTEAEIELKWPPWGSKIKCPRWNDEGGGGGSGTKFWKTITNFFNGSNQKGNNKAKSGKGNSSSNGGSGNTGAGGSSNEGGSGSSSSGGNGNQGGWSGNGGWNNSGNGSNYGNSGESSTENELSRLKNNFNELCDYKLNLSPTHQAIAASCYRSPDFNLCVLKEFSKIGVEDELITDCWAQYYKNKYDLTDEEWEYFKDLNYLNGDETVTPTEEEQLSFNLCPSSLNYEKIQNAYYIKLNNFSYIFRPKFAPLIGFKVSFSSICFEFPDDSNIHDIKETVNTAIKLGITETIKDLDRNHFRTPATQAEILGYLKDNIISEFFDIVVRYRNSIAFGNVCKGVQGNQTLWCQ